MGILSLLLLLPLPALGFLLVVPRAMADRWAYRLSLGSCWGQLGVLAIGILPQYVQQLDRFAARGLRFALPEQLDWLSLELGDAGRLEITYFLGLDGLNILMVALSVIILLVATVASRGVTHRPRAYFALLLLLNTAMLGCFLALDLFLFYVFYELMLLPLFFLIGLWGSERGSFAALKFFLYTLFGSLFMLVVIVGLYFSYIDPVATAVELDLAPRAGAVTQPMIEHVQQMLAAGRIPAAQQVHSFSFLHLTTPANQVPGALLSQGDYRLWAFGGLFLAFAIKLPMVPLHTWLPDAHVEASTPISVVLAGILLKVGGYGMLRLAYGIFPEAGMALGWWLALFGVVSVLYGALNAMAQTDLKRMIAYASISHMGLVLLGIACLRAEAVNGAVYMLFNHGIVSAMLFLIAGVLKERVGDRTISKFQGLWHKMPRYTTAVMMAFFAALALPGFGIFISELLIYAGALAAESTTGAIPRYLALAAVPGIILTAAYFLRTLRRMFFGPYAVMGGDAWDAQLTDLSRTELWLFGGLGALALLTGLMPHLFLNLVDETVARWVQAVLAASQGSGA